LLRSLRGLSDAGELLVKNEDGEWLKLPPWAMNVVGELDPDERCGFPFSPLLSGCPGEYRLLTKWAYRIHEDY